MNSRFISCDARQALVDCDAPMVCGENCHNYHVVVVERALDGEHFRRMEEKLRQNRRRLYDVAESQLRVDAIKYAARW